MGRSAAARPSGSSETIELLVTRRCPDERRDALGEEGRTDALVLDDARPVEQLLDAHARLIRCGDRDGRRSLDHRETDLTWERAQGQAERAAVDCGARRGGGDGHAGAVKREISVGGGDAETRVETVRELGRPHRPEPVVERDAPLAAETEMACRSLQDPDGECLVQRLVGERLRPQGRPRGECDPARADQPDRPVEVPAECGRRLLPGGARERIPSMVVRGGTASRSTTHSPPSASAGSASSDEDNAGGDEKPTPPGMAARDGRDERVRHGSGLR